MGKVDSNVILMNTIEEGFRRRKRMEKCVTNEEWCFLCYVGGLLLFCEHEDCIKACHPKCLGKDDSVVNSGNSWTCDAHSCLICYKGQDFNCVGCPKALCRRCIGQVEFVQIKGNKGLCGVCLKNVLLVEDKKDGDYDRKFMENFGSAWKIIRERESLTLKDLRCAEERMKKGDFYMSGCNSDENDERVKSDIYDTFPMKNKKRRSISLFQYALIEPENMTLVYLKRGLVKKLVKGTRTLFDNKVIGSFVKILASRNDRFDQNVFKLLQVTGTTWTYNGENDPEVLLHVSGMENKISINLLRNCDVAEEECKDLKIRIQRGLLKQPTVDELEDKARILYEDIKNHGGLFVVKSAESQAALDFLENEANILENLSSPHIVKSIGREKLKGVNGARKLNLFIEYMAGGSLADIADKFEGVLDERMVRLYTREILKGLVYLHRNGVVHCDLKCKNVLLSSSGNIKLADFGCAKRLNGPMTKSRSMGSLESICGTPLWMAPEVMRKEGVDYSADIWSLGCTVIEMATGKPPKWGDQISNPMAAVYKIARSNETPKFPAGFSKEGLDFLHKCFERNAKKRWTSENLLQHPFVCGESEERNAENVELWSPSSVLDAGIYKEDEDDFVSEESICEREINRRIPFTMRSSGERDCMSHRHSTNSLFASSGNWITVRI